MLKTDVLVIGGSAAGLVSAVTARSNYPDKKVMVIRKENKVVVPCGIPYIFGSLESSDQDVIPDAKLENAGVDLLVDEVISVDLENKKCTTQKGEEVEFEKLVFATGSTPKIPKWLPGTELDNVFTVPKDKDYLDVFSFKTRWI